MYLLHICICKSLHTCINTLNILQVVPFGGGTSLEGHTLVAKSSGTLSLDFAQMQRIVEFNNDDMDVTVQPGLG
jgi:D-lactate dehydrogenase (cytochrome)